MDIINENHNIEKKESSLVIMEYPIGKPGRYKKIETTILNINIYLTYDFNNFFIMQCSPEPVTMEETQHFFILDKNGGNQYKKLLNKIIKNEYNDNSYEFHYILKFIKEKEFLYKYYIYEIINIKPCKIKSCNIQIKKVSSKIQNINNECYKEVIILSKNNNNTHLNHIKRFLISIGENKIKKNHLYMIKYKKFYKDNYYRILEAIDTPCNIVITDQVGTDF
jgi:hypothetical protein